jgi:hypothetical protein
MSGCVIVMGLPERIWRRNKGTTDPDDPSTLPNRTIEKTVSGLRSAAAWKISSAMRLEAPIRLVGRTALSVEISTQVSTPASRAASATAWVPSALFTRPTRTLASTIGTCL